MLSCRALYHSMLFLARGRVLHAGFSTSSWLRLCVTPPPGRDFGHPNKQIHVRVAAAGRPVRPRLSDCRPLRDLPEFPNYREPCEGARCSK